MFLLSTRSSTLGLRVQRDKNGYRVAGSAGDGAQVTGAGHRVEQIVRGSKRAPRLFSSLLSGGRGRRSWFPFNLTAVTFLTLVNEFAKHSYLESLQKAGKLDERTFRGGFGLRVQHQRKLQSRAILLVETKGLDPRTLH